MKIFAFLIFLFSPLFADSFQILSIRDTNNLGHVEEALSKIEWDGTKKKVVFDSVSIAQKEIDLENLQEYDLIHLEGSCLLKGTFCEKALHAAKQGNIPVSLDFGSTSLGQAYRERILSLLSFHANVFFASEEEAFALTGLPPEQAALFLNNFCKVVVIKATNHGCWVASNQKNIYFPEKSEKPDAAHELFASGFLYGFINGLPLETCAHFGNLISN